MAFLYKIKLKLKRNENDLACLKGPLADEV